MRAYRAVTGNKGSISEFWKLSPAELFAWCDAAVMEEPDPYEDLECGEEVFE